jgi:DNA-binding FrmR family transcriptional regulator
MSVTEKAPGGAAKDEVLEVLESVTRFYTKGVERMVEAQKKGIDMVLQQNAAYVNQWKKPFDGSWTTAGINLVDLATSAVDRGLTAQKEAINVMVEEGHELAGLVKESTAAVAKSVQANWAIPQETINAVIAAQKTAVDCSAKQTKAAYETAKERLGLAGTPAGVAADSVQRGVDVVASAQKELLDIIKEPVLV